MCEICDELLGTCQSISDVETDILSYEEIEEAIIKCQLIELCACCGWWCEISELYLVNEENICTQCLPDVLDCANCEHECAEVTDCQKLSL